MSAKASPLSAQGGALGERVRRWLRRAQGPDGRCVVVDTETEGLDPARHALLAVGAVAVDAAGIRLGDSFEAVLRNEPAGATSVLVHGIGHAAQRAGIPAPQALRAFEAYRAGAPCIAFHAAFDEAVLGRAYAESGTGPAPGPWLDLAELARALLPAPYKRGLRSLDDWLPFFGIATLSRHTAAGDALASAELLLRLRALAAKQGDRGFAALARLARERRWLGSA